jgi:uncharacterized membrane protein
MTIKYWISSKGQLVKKNVVFRKTSTNICSCKILLCKLIMLLTSNGSSMTYEIKIIEVSNSSVKSNALLSVQVTETGG